MRKKLKKKKLLELLDHRSINSTEAHRRSIRSEAITCVEVALPPTKVTPTERLSQARVLRAQLAQDKLEVADINKLKRQGRS